MRVEGDSRVGAVEKRPRSVEALGRVLCRGLNASEGVLLKLPRVGVAARFGWWRWGYSRACRSRGGVTRFSCAAGVSCSGCGVCQISSNDM